jgi:cytochrome c biogenesis protein CcmG, thiol:disulfide interchange protein DsbE
MTGERKTGGMSRWWAVFVVLLIAGPVWLWATRIPLDAQPAALNAEPALGHPAPEFTLTTLDGQTWQLAAQRGTPVVINFWATWCGPCRQEMPTLEATATRYAGQVHIVGVDQGEEQAVVQEFIDEEGITFTIAMDRDTEVGRRYNVMGLPTTFFVDADGIIRHIWTGEMNSVTLAEGIAKIWP